MRSNNNDNCFHIFPRRCCATRLLTLSLAQTAAYSDRGGLLPHQWTALPVWNRRSCQGKPDGLCQLRNGLRVSRSPRSASYLPSVWTTVYSSGLPARQTERDRNFRGGAEAEYLLLFSDELGKRPRLYICLGIIACTSENEAFKGDSENNHFYSQREGDISSFFQGQVPALLRSAPVIVAAGECV